MKVKQRGFTLVEVMVAITIILIALLPIFGSMYGILKNHREVLDKEIAIGLARSAENILDSQKDFYTYVRVSGSWKIKSIRDVWSDGEEHPIILHKDNGSSYDPADYVISVPTNSKTFRVRAYAMKNPKVCNELPSGSCSSYDDNPYLYAVRIEILWEEGSSTKSYVVVRRFYKP